MIYTLIVFYNVQQLRIRINIVIGNEWRFLIFNTKHNYSNYPCYKICANHQYCRKPININKFIIRIFGDRNILFLFRILTLFLFHFNWVFYGLVLFSWPQPSNKRESSICSIAYLWNISRNIFFYIVCINKKISRPN